MQHKVQLTVHEPPVEIIWRDTEVKCGKTSVNVREYGHVGSGDWAVWISSGHTIDGTHSAADLHKSQVCDDRITIPKPTVPYGPEGVDPDVATADYMRELVRKIDGRYCVVGGSNVTATVRTLLLDVADALAKPAAIAARARGDHTGERAALDTLALIERVKDRR